MKLFFAGIAFFILIVWMPVEAAWSAFCFNNYDLGIYAQALQELSFSNLNPWLSVRQLFLFNDHFEPIFFLLLPLKSFLPAALLEIRVEALAILLAACAPMWLTRKRLISVELGLCVAAIILFGPFTLDAAFFPAHPGTWSLAPLAWMLAFLFAGRDRAALMMLIVICMCKEEYPVLGVGLGMGLCFVDRKIIGSAFFVTSVVWGVAVFIVRPWLIGPASIYTDAVSHGAGLLMLLSAHGLKEVAMRHAEMILPLVPLLYGQSFYGSRSRGRRTFPRSMNILGHGVIVPVIGLLSMLAIRFAGGYWGGHRVAPLGVLSGFVVIFWLGDQKVSRLRRQWFAVLMLVFSFPSLEFGSRFWRNKPFKHHCPEVAGRLESLRQASDYLRKHADGPVLAGGNLIPQLVDLPGIAHIGRVDGAKFKYFLVEKYLKRNPYPLEPDELFEIESSWRLNPSIRIIQDDEFVLLIEKKN